MSSRGAIEGGQGGGFPWRFFGLGLVAIALLGAGAWLALDLAQGGAVIPADPVALAAGPASSPPSRPSLPASTARPTPTVHPQRPEPPDERPPEAVPPFDGPTGLAAFPPMGTKPIQRGIVVPEGFELPPGYLRHYQTTDGGEQLPPILKFHPDYTPSDAAGNPVPLPKDRVVPAELAPPGLPIQYLEAPAASDRSDAAR